MQINLNRDQINSYACRYSYPGDDELARIMGSAAKRGYMNPGDLMAVAKWKWRGGRTIQLCSRNTEAEVKEITKVSFAAKSGRLRICALLALDGVGWPMASVILHFAFPNCYPILDVRAMKAVGGSTFYTLERWLEYAQLCRTIASNYGVTMRTLDRALWVYGGELP